MKQKLIDKYKKYDIIVLLMETVPSLKIGGDLCLESRKNVCPF